MAPSAPAAAAALEPRVKRLSVLCVVVAITLELPACSADDARSAPPALPVAESIETDLGAAACEQRVDRDDPNETRYRFCPGVAGYALLVRKVEAGRQSIDVVDARQRAHALNLHEVVTRHMLSIDRVVEWRLAGPPGTRQPIALIVGVQAREDVSDPETITRTYHAVAKLRPEGACITDRIVGGTLTPAALRRLADTALARECLPPLPPMVLDGAPVR